MCTRLDFIQPLVHGDVAKSNASIRDDQVVLIFDWEFAYISHPFCDFQYAKMSTSGIPEEVLDE